jgi:hypothetical protein
MIKRRQVKCVSFLDLKDHREQSSYFFSILIVFSYILVVVTFPLSLCFCLKVCIIIYINKKMNSFFINHRLYKNMKGQLYFD